MATESLIVELDAQTSKLDTKIGRVDKNLTELEGQVRKTDKSLDDMSGTMFALSRVASALAVAISTISFVAFSDEIQIADNQLKNVTTTTEQYLAVSSELNRIAQETRQSVTELTSVYARFARAGAEAGFTQREILDLTESLTKAFKIEGNTTAEVNSTLLQLTQSFRSGRIQGEEFRAVSESSTLVLQALASQLRVNVGELKELAAQGLITPQILLEGLKGSEEEIRNQFRSLEPTFAEVGASLGNVFAAAYKDSVFEQVATDFKSFIIETSSDLQRFFSGEENLSLGELQSSLESTKKRIIEIREIQQKSSLDYGLTLRRLGEEVIDLEQRISALRKTQIESPLDIEITGGTQDERIEREKQFIEILTELRAQAPETLEEQLNREVEINRLALERKLIDEEEFRKRQTELSERYVKNKALETKQDSKFDRERLAQQSAYLSAASSLATVFFEDNKALRSALVIADTAAGITRQFADLPYPAALATSAAIAASGVAQLAAINSSDSGGTISATTATSTSTETAQDFDQQSASLELTEQTTTGSQQLVVNVPDGDEIGEAIANWLTKAQREGRV